MRHYADIFLYDCITVRISRAVADCCNGDRLAFGKYGLVVCVVVDRLGCVADSVNCFYRVRVNCDGNNAVVVYFNDGNGKLNGNVRMNICYRLCICRYKLCGIAEKRNQSGNVNGLAFVGFKAFRNGALLGCVNHLTSADIESYGFIADSEHDVRAVLFGVNCYARNNCTVYGNKRTLQSKQFVVAADFSGNVYGRNRGNRIIGNFNRRVRNFV